ncbi:hypothetical protein FQR65_LT17134 [Abscondita terminalis]|nr:hypothetical protein FQR65_LT17134 [Abscondita terminalis]
MGKTKTYDHAKYGRKYKSDWESENWARGWLTAAESSSINEARYCSDVEPELEHLVSEHDSESECEIESEEELSFPNTQACDTNSSDDEVENVPQNFQKAKKYFYGKNRYKWSDQEPTRNVRNPARNILRLPQTRMFKYKGTHDESGWSKLKRKARREEEKKKLPKIDKYFVGQDQVDSSGEGTKTVGTSAVEESQEAIQIAHTESTAATGAAYDSIISAETSVVLGNCKIVSFRIN